jgi:hypothetical protein
MDKCIICCIDILYRIPLSYLFVVEDISIHSNVKWLWAYIAAKAARLYTYIQVICIYQRECRDAMCDIDTQRPNHMRVSFFYCCCLSRCELILFTFCNVMAQSFGIVNSESLPKCKMGRFPSLMTHVSIRYIYISL